MFEIINFVIDVSVSLDFVIIIYDCVCFVKRFILIHFSLYATMYLTLVKNIMIRYDMIGGIRFEFILFKYN